MQPAVNARREGRVPRYYTHSSVLMQEDFGFNEAQPDCLLTAKQPNNARRFEVRAANARVTILYSEDLYT